ncbi:MAG TPA: DUF4296 domain-containing protein [Bacteroidales bacterium]|nr:DUF4296 domain-containing protein [Bacteroidales bacterium]
MRRYIKIIASLAIVMVTLSCSSRKNEADKSDIIPEKKMTDLIVDLYLTDGLLLNPNVKGWYNATDSLSEYDQVLKNHGYTKEYFDRTIRYYFIKRPKKLQDIYENALAKLSEMESKTQLEVKRAQNKLRNAWHGGDYFAWPGKNGDDSTSFDVFIQHQGSYTAQFVITLYPDDQSINPRFFGYMINADSLETGKRRYLNSINFIKDGQPHKFAYTFYSSGFSKYKFKGSFFYHDNMYRQINKHVIIEDISLSEATE